MNILRKITSHDLSKMMVKASSVLAIKIIGSGISFVFSFLVARKLGAEQGGYFFLALSIVMILSIAARLGFEGTLLRYLSRAAATHHDARMRQLVRTITSIVCLSSLVIATALVLAADPIARLVFDKPDLAGPLSWMGLSVVTLNMIRLSATMLKAIDQQSIAELVGSVIQPSLAIAALIPFIFAFDSLAAAVSYMLASAITVGTGILFWKHCFKAFLAAKQPGPREDTSQSEPEIALNTLFKSALPLWISSVINLALLPWLPLLILGMFANAVEVGIFGVATRIANLIGVFMSGVISVPAPRFARMEKNGNRQGIGRLSRNFATIVTAAVLPVFLILFFASSWVLGLFGPEFATGAGVLIILAIGQFTIVLVGPVRMVLIMTGHEKGLRNASLVSLCVLSVLLIALVPPFGALGAAIAAAGSTIVTSFLPVPIAYRACGTMPVPGLHFFFSEKTPR